MNRELAKRLKMAGFPVARYQSGHKFYPNEAAASWSEATQRTVSPLADTNWTTMQTTSKAAIIVQIA